MSWLCSLLLLLTLGSLLGAPSTATTPADGSSPETLLAALNATISGPAGHRDWTRFRALWLPGARIQFARVDRHGKVTISTLSPEDYIRQDDPYFAAHAFYETTLVQRTERYGNIAQIWTSFALRHTPTGPATQRGVETCQFLFDGQRWWLANLLDQPELATQPLPADLGGAI